MDLVTLVDFSSTHTLMTIHEDVARRLGLSVEARPGVSVKVANGTASLALASSRTVGLPA